ncbi:MAG: NupC/NupG family nucleoside CNT transporter [Candidatus Brocadiae bacterium]|nr:NupC/NupG family nucleoside CNT transporter [Candidatus Brocadiia bacterium]
MALLQRLTGLLGIVALLGIAFALSRNRRRIPVGTVLWGLGLQVVFAVLILKTPWGRVVFDWANAAFTRLIGFTDDGAKFVFGDWGAPVEATHLVTKKPHAIGFVLAFKVLPVLIFFASLMSVLYHLGVMQKLVSAAAWVMRYTMKVSGAEALSAAGNIFVGMTEAPLLIRPYVGKLTQSELMAVMTGGLATIAGSVLALYVSFGIEPGHLLCASVMSAPAALVVAKIMLPETEEPATAGSIQVEFERKTTNVIDAAASGAWEGLRLALNVAAMLLAFVALLALVNFLIGQVHTGVAWATGWQGFPSSLQDILGLLFRPLAFVMGVPWGEAKGVGTLLGVKISLNELIAYQQLVAMKGQLSARSVTIATYALCGFANFGSIGIMIGGISGMAPERRADLSRLSLRALAGGAIASFLTACIAGILL